MIFNQGGFFLPLGLSTDVHRRPAQCQRTGREDTRSSKEHADVAHTGTRDRVGVADEDGVADDSGQAGGNDEGCSDTDSLGDDGVDDSQGCGQRVWRDGEKLSFVGLVAEVLDDRWLWEMMLVQSR